MFTKIVVGVDGLDGGEDALALANVLAGPEARIVAVNAFPCETHPTRASAVVEGSAVERLGELSEDVDLLVTGSRGWGAARRVLLGSTSDGLAHHAHCPVVVVPSPVSEPQQAEESEVAHA